MAALVAANGASLISLVPAQAKSAKDETKTQSNQTISLDGDAFVINGQTYTLSGSADLRTSVKQKGDTTTVKFHYDPKHTTLRAPDGAVYKFSGSSDTTTRVGASGGSFKSDAKFRLVGAGKGNKMRLRVTLRGNVDSSGQITFDKSTYQLV